MTEACRVSLCVLNGVFLSVDTGVYGTGISCSSAVQMSMGRRLKTRLVRRGWHRERSATNITPSTPPSTSGSRSTLTFSVAPPLNSRQSKRNERESVSQTSGIQKVPSHQKITLLKHLKLKYLSNFHLKHIAICYIFTVYFLNNIEFLKLKMLLMSTSWLFRCSQHPSMWLSLCLSLCLSESLRIFSGVCTRGVFSWRTRWNSCDVRAVSASWPIALWRACALTAVTQKPAGTSVTNVAVSSMPWSSGYARRPARLFVYVPEGSLTWVFLCLRIEFKDDCVIMSVL